MSSSEEEIFLRGSKSSAPTLSSSGRAKRAASNRVSSYADVENSSNEEEVDEDDDSDDVSIDSNSKRKRRKANIAKEKKPQQMSKNVGVSSSAKAKAPSQLKKSKKDTVKVGSVKPQHTQARHSSKKAAIDSDSSEEVEAEFEVVSKDVMPIKKQRAPRVQAQSSRKDNVGSTAKQKNKHRHSSESNTSSSEEEDEEQWSPKLQNKNPVRKILRRTPVDDEEEEYMNESDMDEAGDEGGEEEDDEFLVSSSSGARARSLPSVASNRARKNASDTNISTDVNVVLKEVRSAREILERNMSNKHYMASTADDLAGVVAVEDRDAHSVSLSIEKLVVHVVQQILSGKNSHGFEYTIPNRTASNQRYLPSLDRIVLGDKTSSRAFLNTAHVRKTAITTRVSFYFFLVFLFVCSTVYACKHALTLSFIHIYTQVVELVHEVLNKNIHITKRDLFYTDVKLFKDQNESDAVLDDVACMLGCTRTSLHVVASDKGLVVGRIQYRESGDYIDCTRMGVGGKAIPPYIDQITDITSDAEFIILVEKEAAYMRLAEDRFYNKYKCIVITGKGQPDVATRLFLHKVRAQLKIPVLALVDSDPYGLKVRPNPKLKRRCLLVIDLCRVCTVLHRRYIYTIYIFACSSHSHLFSLISYIYNI